MKTGWRRRPLDEVCIVEYGTRVVQKRDGGSGYPVYGGGGATFAMNTFNREGRVVIGRFGMSEQCTRFVSGKFFLNDSGLTLSPKTPTDLLPEFLDKWAFSVNDEIYSLGKGTAQKNLDVTAFRSMQVPLAPLSEQHRIVGILDETFAGIATAKANAEKNLQNARALFENHLRSVFSQRGEGWADTKLEDVCGFQNGFAFTSSSFKPCGCPILRISNIQDGQIETDKLVFFDPKDYRQDLHRYRVIADDLLIAMSGATTGKLGFNMGGTVFYLNQRVGKFEPGIKLNKRFLYYFLSTKVEENLRISVGAAQPNLSTEQIRAFVLPLPCIEDQARVVETLESLSARTRHLKSIYQRKLSALEALKKSLLHDAFRGAL